MLRENEGGNRLKFGFDPKDERLYRPEDMTPGEVEDACMNHGNGGLIKTLKNLGMLEIIDMAGEDTLFTDDGRKLYNFQAGYGSVPFGSSNGKVNIVHAAMTRPQAAALRLIAVATPGDLKRVFLGNSGGEVNDAAIQACLFATGARRPILTAENGYHGRTGLTRLSTPSNKAISGLNKLRLLTSRTFGCRQGPVFEQVPYGDLVALEKKIKQVNPCAFLLEPVQGEAGAIRPPKGYLRGVESICRRYGVFVIYDEVQTGLGRTGSLFACQLDANDEWQPHPDGMLLAKALGGGETAVAAFVATEELWQRAYGGQNYLRQSTTFGGHANACDCILRSVHRIVCDDLSSVAKEMGEYMMNQLAPLRNHFLVKDFTGAGLLVGMHLNIPSALGDMAAEAGIALIASRLAEKGIFPVVSLMRPVLRFEPPLLVSKEAIDALVTALTEVLNSYPSQGAFVAAAVGKGIKALRG